MNVEYLETHGPSTSDGLPEPVSVEDKMKGVWEFNVRGASQISKAPRPVFYLENEHSKEEVIRKWLDVNDDIVSRLDRTSASMYLRRQGRDWHDAVDAVLDEYFGVAQRTVNEHGTVNTSASGGTSVVVLDDSGDVIARRDVKEYGRVSGLKDYVGETVTVMRESQFDDR